jgi:predicted aldo/keto reductase-like oxidoreductase
MRIAHFLAVDLRETGSSLAILGFGEMIHQAPKEGEFTGQNINTQLYPKISSVVMEHIG